jgi:YggT family protein
MASFVYHILDSLLMLLMWAIIISAVFSWLVAFNVVNVRNRFVAQLLRFLDAVTAPVLAPARRIIPAFGGVDVSPIIVILIIQGARAYLLPMLFRPLQSVLG